ncbi:hypothetical protein C8R43DRAFT_370715 [Mycena crocata]|nr:hypothetical protein C8R43DRAFT_370715 [Mycena crocata]
MEPPPTTGLLYLPITDLDEEYDIPAPGSKRRRLRGACDTCRQRKIRCDSGKMPGNVCSHCIAFNTQCTHRGFPKSDSTHNTSRNASSNNSARVSTPASPSAQPFEV